MKPLQAQWAEYMQLAMPAGAPDIQINEGKICFFAGAQAMYKIMTQVVPEMSDEQAMLFLKHLGDELQAFAKEYLATGKVP